MVHNYHLTFDLIEERINLCFRSPSQYPLIWPCHLVNIVFLAECVEDNVDLIQHVHHLHGCNVDADLVELHHITEKDGHIWENLQPMRQRHYF